MHILNPHNGTWVFLSFLAFFGVIIAVNTVFITTALDTHSGVVTKQPYEKGLAYNEVLKKANLQADIEHNLSFKDGVLALSIPTTEADVTASFFRAVKDGHDFKVTLNNNGDGSYSAQPNFTLPGAWTVRVKSQWDDQTFSITKDIIAP